MKVFYDLKDLPEFKNAVLTIGSFDGVHFGHQQILERINHLARDVEGESIVITFHPHPRLVIYPKDKSLQLITSINEKIQLLERYGVDNVVVVPFTVEFSQQSADEYIEKFLVGKFHPRYVVIGYDHRFGLNRQGDINYLKHHSTQHNFEVIEIGKHEVETIAVSSTKVRAALDAGDVASAHSLLNHYFTLTGTVVHGQKIGNTIGFPTANVEIADAHKLVPPFGVYSVFVHHNGNRYGGMLYIGDRPVLKDHHNRTIEVNIFDFDKNIYGDRLQLELVDFLRPDTKFNNLDELKTALHADQQKAQQQLAQYEQATEVSTNQQFVQTHVDVVILNYNGKDYLEQFLPPLLASSYPNFTVHVADNGSTDDSLVFLKNHYPQVRRLVLNENHGFAEGYNRALQQIKSDYYMLLNSDVEVTENWLESQVALLLAEPNIAVVQPKILDFNQRDHFEYAGAAGGWLDNWGYPFCRGRVFATVEEDKGQYDEQPTEIFWASGAAMLIRAPLFHDLGGFDGEYFAHMEEIDLCWRVKRAGYQVVCQPAATVYHVGGGTLQYESPRKTYLNFRNSLYTIYKNEPANKLLWLIPLRLILDGLAAVLFLTQGKIPHISSIIRAHWTFFPRMRSLWKKRQRVSERIERVSISNEMNNNGRHPRGIILAYYLLGKRKFSEIRV
ncbi:MAG: bifunctional riboflavin kinase/FAD synthetase [Saprospiraceae bacterium]